jgi:hypothetical protein
MLKHVGKHNNQKIVIVFRQLPGEDDQALIVYPNSLPSLLHDEMMKCLESAVGQASNSINEVFFRTIMADGTSILTSLHVGGFLSKVPANSVTVTPTSNSNEDIKLDKLNSLIKQISSGEPMGRDLGDPVVPASEQAQVLNDEDLAKQRLDQATTMKLEAKRLIAEAERLEKEAQSLAPQNATKTKKTTKKQTVAS